MIIYHTQHPITYSSYMPTSQDINRKQSLPTQSGGKEIILMQGPSNSYPWSIIRKACLIELHSA